MANALNQNPILVDTVMGTSFKNTAGSLPNNGPLYVSKVEWFSPVTAADTFVMTDGTGSSFLQGACETALQSQIFDFIPPRGISDFTVGTIASGKLKIYLI